MQVACGLLVHKKKVQIIPGGMDKVRITTYLFVGSILLQNYVIWFNLPANTIYFSFISLHTSRTLIQDFVGL